MVIVESQLRRLIREELKGWVRPEVITNQGDLGQTKVKLTANTAPGQAEIGIGNRFSLRLTTYDLAKLRDFVNQVITDILIRDREELKQTRRDDGDFWRPQRAA